MDDEHHFLFFLFAFSSFSSFVQPHFIIPFSFNEKSKGPWQEYIETHYCILPYQSTHHLKNTHPALLFTVSGLFIERVVTADAWLTRGPDQEFRWMKRNGKETRAQLEAVFSLPKTISCLNPGGPLK